MDALEVFADVGCPFAHVGLRRFVAERERRGVDRPRLRVRAWPLEVVNGTPLDAHVVATEVVAMRHGVAPDLFAGFAEDRYPATTLPALAAEAAAYRAGAAEGEAFSLAIRGALFERGLDVADADVLADLLAAAGLPAVTNDDVAAVHADHRAGTERGVRGSPHFFAGNDGFFCPALHIEHHGDDITVTYDHEQRERFMAAAFA